MQNNYQTFSEGKQYISLQREDFNAVLDKKISELKKVFQDKRLIATENRKSRFGYLDLPKIIRSYGFISQDYIEPFSSGEESDIDDERLNEPSMKDACEKLIDFRTIISVKKIVNIPRNARPGVIITNLDEWVNSDIMKRFIDEIPLLAENKIAPAISEIRIMNYKNNLFAFILFLNYEHCKKTFSFFNHPLKKLNNPTKNSKGEKMGVYYAFDLLDMYNSDWYGVILRNIPEKSTHEDLKKHLSNYSKNLNYLSPSIKIKNSCCALVVLNTLEEAEKICKYFNKKELGNNRIIKAHLHPRTCKMRKNPQNSIFENFFKLENGNFASKYTSNDLGNILNNYANNKNTNRKYIPLSKIVSITQNVASNISSTDPKKDLDEIESNKPGLKDRENLNAKAKPSNVLDATQNNYQLHNQKNPTNSMKRSTNDILMLNLEEEEKNKKKTQVDMNTSYLFRLLNLSNKTEENKINKANNPITSIINQKQENAKNNNNGNTMNQFSSELKNLSIANENKDCSTNKIGKLRNKKLEGKETAKKDLSNSRANSFKLNNNLIEPKVDIEVSMNTSKNPNNDLEEPMKADSNDLNHKEKSQNRPSNLSNDNISLVKNYMETDDPNNLNINENKINDAKKVQAPSLNLDKKYSANLKNQNTSTNSNINKTIVNLEGILQGLVKFDKEKSLSQKNLNFQVNDENKSHTKEANISQLSDINETSDNIQESSINIKYLSSSLSNNIDMKPQDSTSKLIQEESAINNKSQMEQDKEQLDESSEEIIDMEYSGFDSDFFKHDFQDKSYYEKPKYNKNYSKGKEDKQHTKSIFDRSKDRDKDKERDREKNFSSKFHEKSSKKYVNNIDDNYYNHQTSNNFNNINQKNIINPSFSSNSNKVIPANSQLNQINSNSNKNISNFNSTNQLNTSTSVNTSNFIPNSTNSKIRLSNFSSTINPQQQTSQISLSTNKVSIASLTNPKNVSTNQVINVSSNDLPINNINTKNANPKSNGIDADQNQNTLPSNPSAQTNLNLFANNINNKHINNIPNYPASQPKQNLVGSGSIVFSNNQTIPTQQNINQNMNNPLPNNYMHNKLNNAIPFNPIIHNNSTIINNYINIIPPTSDIKKEISAKQTNMNNFPQSFSNNISFQTSGSMPNVNIVFPQNAKIINNMNITNPNIQLPQNYINFANIKNPEIAKTNNNIVNNPNLTSNTGNSSLSANPDKIIKNENNYANKNDIILPPLDDFIPPLPPENPPEPDSIGKVEQQDMNEPVKNNFSPAFNEFDDSKNEKIDFKNINNHVNIHNNVYITNYDKAEPGQIVGYSSDDDNLTKKNKKIDVKNAPINTKKYSINRSSSNSSSSYRKDKNLIINKKREREKSKIKDKERNKEKDKYREKDRGDKYRDKDDKKEKNRRRDKDYSNKDKFYRDNKFKQASRSNSFSDYNKNSIKESNNKPKYEYPRDRSKDKKFNNHNKKIMDKIDENRSSSSSSFQSDTEEGGRYFKRFMERRNINKKRKET